MTAASARRSIGMRFVRATVPEKQLEYVRAGLAGMPGVFVNLTQPIEMTVEHDRYGLIAHQIHAQRMSLHALRQQQQPRLLW